MTAQPTIQRRAQDRTHMLVTATIISSAGPQSVLVRDVSKAGAQIYTQLLGERDDVCLSRGTVFVAACVIWCRRGVAGLQFYRELSASELSGAFSLPAVVTAESSTSNGSPKVRPLQG